MSNCVLISPNFHAECEIKSVNIHTRAFEGNYFDVGINTWVIKFCFDVMLYIHFYFICHLLSFFIMKNKDHYSLQKYSLHFGNRSVFTFI